jgi:hypothetical protein
MVTVWKAARRRALLKEPCDTLLAEYLECFAAGYNRGVEDVRKTVRRKVWTLLIDSISDQLVVDRSVLEAGCWLAGVYMGREDAIAGLTVEEGRLAQRFCSGWETAYIADCALECDPTAVKFHKLLMVVFLGREIASINDRLASEVITYQLTTWEQACNDSDELDLPASNPAKQA